jgi:ligand-binding SRPBCC domain-containing protein
MLYQLYREQQLNCDIETAWNFFSSPFNLSKITPKDMSFKVVSNLADQPIYEGMEIDYRVSPLLKIPMRWKTVITQVEEQKSFIDFQKEGPYKYWNHLHEFLPNDHGVLMKDTVDYALPLGILGTIAHSLFVRRQLEDIFNFRYRFLEDFFNQKSK